MIHLPFNRSICAERLSQGSSPTPVVSSELICVLVSFYFFVSSDDHKSPYVRFYPFIGMHMLLQVQYRNKNANVVLNRLFYLLQRKTRAICKASVEIILHHQESVSHLHGSCVKRLSAIGKVDDIKALKQIVTLLSAPLDKYNNVMTALKLSNYSCVIEYLDSATKKVMATIIIKSIMKNNTQVSTGDKVEALFESIKGLIKDIDGSEEDEIDEEDFKEEQNSVARLIQMLHNEDPKEMFKIITIVRQHILTGGLKRLSFTVPLVFSSLKLVRMLKNLEQDESGEETADLLTKIFQLLNQILEGLLKLPESRKRDDC